MPVTDSSAPFPEPSAFRWQAGDAAVARETGETTCDVSYVIHRAARPDLAVSASRFSSVEGHRAEREQLLFEQICHREMLGDFDG